MAGTPLKFDGNGALVEIADDALGAAVRLDLYAAVGRGERVFGRPIGSLGSWTQFPLSSSGLHRALGDPSWAWRVLPRMIPLGIPCDSLVHDVARELISGGPNAGMSIWNVCVGFRHEEDASQFVRTMREQQAK